LHEKIISGKDKEGDKKLKDTYGTKNTVLTGLPGKLSAKNSSKLVGVKFKNPAFQRISNAGQEDDDV